MGLAKHLPAKALIVLIALAAALAGSPALATTAYAETTTFPATFYENTLTESELTINVDWDDEWFAAPHTSYNHKIAQASLAMTAAAFRHWPYDDLTQTDANLSSFFDNAGFSHFEGYNYDQSPTGDSITNGIAMRAMSDDQGPYVLVAVAISGQGYGAESASNFLVGTDSEHLGFLQAAQTVYDRLTAYIQEYVPNQRVKIWVSGHSRAAATGNALGNIILSSGDFDNNGIFVYTFSTPNTTKNPVAWPQIYNICNGFDVVPRVPLGEWGYGKYGTTLFLPTISTSVNYRELVARATETFRSLTGLSRGFDSNHEGDIILARIMDLLYQLMPESSSYVESIQDDLVTAWSQDTSSAECIVNFLKLAEEHGLNREVLGKIRSEFATYVKLIVGQASNVITGQSTQDDHFVEALFSDAGIIHEHQPAITISWMFSDISPEELFAGGSIVHRLIYTGDFDLRIIRTDAQSGESTCVYDSLEGIAECCVIPIDELTVVDLPSKEYYTIEMTAKSDTNAQLFFGCLNLDMIAADLWNTNAITLEAGETLTGQIVPEGTYDFAASFKLNENSPVAFLHTNSIFTLLDILGSSSALDTGSFQQLMAGTLAMVLYMITSIFVVLYAVIAGIRRRIRGKSRQDKLPCNSTGKVLLILAFVFSLAIFAWRLVDLIRLLTGEGVISSSVSLQRIADLVGTGRVSLVMDECLLFAFLTVLAYRSLEHGTSRKHLTRLAGVLAVTNGLTSLVYQALSLTDALTIVTFCVPIFVFFTGVYVRVSKGCKAAAPSPEAEEAQA